MKPTRNAARKCVEWLAFCLSIGWSTERLVNLESMWWRGHKPNGELRTPREYRRVKATEAKGDE